MDYIKKYFGNSKNFWTVYFAVALGLVVAGYAVSSIPGYEMFNLKFEDWHMIAFAWGCTVMFAVPCVFIGRYLGIKEALSAKSGE